MKPKPIPSRTTRSPSVRALFAACLFSLPALASAQSTPTTITAVAAGYVHSMFVTSDGKLWTMGYNYYGQLGDGTFINRITPTLVPSASNVTAVAAGDSYSLYLTGDDKLYITKRTTENTQLEDGTYINGATPALVTSASNIVAVAANDEHSLYVTSDGKLYAMGSNTYGQLGISDTTTYRDSPVLVPSASNVIGVAAGMQHSLYITGDGKLYAMGRNDFGQLGIGSTANQSTPVLVPSASNVIAAAAGYGHSLYLTADGKLYATGWNGSGQLGDGTTTARSTPALVTSASNVIAVTAGSNHNLYLTADGELYGMGDNSAGQLGIGSTANQRTPVQIPSASNVIAMAAGNAYSLYATADGKLFAMGANGYGQLGDGTNTDQKSPVLILDLSNPENTAPAMVTQPISQVAASGGTATFTVAATGTPAPGYQWYLHSYDSYNSYILTPLTNTAPYSGATTATLTITKVTASMHNHQYHCVAKNAVSSASSDFATLIIGAGEAPKINKYPVSRTVTIGQDTYFTIRAYGVPAPAYRWQYSTNGATWANLSNDGIHGGVTTNILTITAAPAALNYMQYRCIASNAKGSATSDPALLIVDPEIPPPSSATITALAAGYGHNLFVTGDGKLWAEGANAEGQLGIGTTESQHTPVLVTSASNVIAVAAGSTGWPHSLYVTNDGKLYGMGYNRYGQLGISNTTNQLTPVQVTTASNVIAADAGSRHSLFVTSDGKLYAMGDNTDGQLGLGDTTNRLTPVQVTSASNVIAIAAGSGYSLYVTDDGKLYGMGNNYSGQLGVSGTASRLTPVQVTSASNVISVAAGSGHSLFVTGDGKLRVMGSNDQGQLGVDDTTDRRTPTLVTSASNVTAVFAGWGHSLYLTSDGNLWGMGYDNPGQLGLGDRSVQHTTPARILSATNVTAVAAGAYHSMFVTGSNRLWDMGEGSGHGLMGVNYTPDIIIDLSNDANVAPAIDTQPVNQAVETGQNVTFSVAATGIPEPIYQWEYNIYNASGWMPITETAHYSGATYGGANTNTLTITNVTSSMNDYRYRCIIKNMAGSVVSDSVTLWVGAPPAITEQPENRSVTAGTSTSFSIRATSSTLAYQWQSSSDDGATWSDLSNTAPYNGANTVSLYIATTPDTLDGMQYRCVVTNPLDTITSNPATLTVIISPAFTTQPKSTTITAGTNTTFTAAATGRPAPTYQWQSDPPDSATWTNLSNSALYGGVTTGTLTITAAPGSLNGSRYRCIASNGADWDATSNTAILTVNVPPAITKQPGDKTVTAGQNTTFTITAAGTPTLTYRWQYSKDGTPWTNLTNTAPYSGVTTTTLTVTSASVALDGTQYRCAVTNSLDTANSAPATLTVIIKPTITTQPDSTTITAGANATFTVAATGFPAPACQWQSSPDGATWTNLSNNATYGGADTGTLTITAAPGNLNGMQYRCIASNGTNSDATSAAATLTVNTPPAIITQPDSPTVLAGQTIVFTVAATGFPAPTYQWQILGTDNRWTSLANNATYNGVTTASLTIANITPAMTGAQYRCTVTNIVSDIFTDPVTLTVATAPAITTHPASQAIPPGQDATFTVIATGVPAPTYQWQVLGSDSQWVLLADNATYSGVTTASLTVTAVTTDMTGAQYRCIAANMAGDATSDPATLTVSSASTAPVVTTHPDNRSIDAGQTATFTITATGNPAPTYQWQSSPDGSTWTDISGATNATLTLTAVTAAMNGTQYRCVATNSVTSATSNPATLTVNAPTLTAPVIAWITGGGSQTVQEGSAATFSAGIVAGSAPFTCTWSKNGTLVATGATSSTNFAYITPATTYADNGATFKIEIVNSAGTASLNATLTVTPSPVTLAQQFKTQLETPGAATITVTGAPDLSLVGGATITSGKTIVGEDATATITGALTIPQTATGIIILGVNFTDGALAINGATDVAISHCTFTDTPIVITGNADNITFSWNRLTATAAATGAAMRITGSGTATGIILHHNLWDANLKTDMPSVTNARVAMFNNYITATGNTTATIAGSGAQILSEHNIYQNTRNPLARQNGGLLRALGNFMETTTGTTAPGDDKIFVPSYPHLMNPAGIDTPGAATLATLITANAGNTAGQNSPTPPATDAAASITATVTGPGATATAAGASVPHAGGFTLTASATGFTPTPPARQWYLDNFAIATATNATHTVTNASAAAHSGAYAVAMTTPAGEIVTSGAFTVTVGELAAPRITTHPASRTITTGGNVTFTVIATGDNLTYQWRQNNDDIPGATAATYTITNARQTHAGSYTVRVGNAAGNIISNPATLTVNAAGEDSSGGNSGSSSSGGGGGGGGAPTLPGLALITALLALRAAKTRR
jgi:alpha-tubulin suppressor-like RCC1 family protein